MAAQTMLVVVLAQSIPIATSFKAHATSVSNLFDVTTVTDTKGWESWTIPSKSKDANLSDTSNVTNLTARSGYGPYWCGSGYSDTCGIDAKYWGCGWRCPRAAPWTNGACGCCCVADTPSPTASPTPYPTPAAAAAAGGMGGASATGDPHLQNLHGERFDLMKPGRHLLIRIPRRPLMYTLLRVDAEAQRLGGHCADMYFQELNITGEWANLEQTGGFHYRAQDVGDKPSRWAQFGNVQLKVALGRTQQGIKYINFYVRDLARAGFSVGGLLGDDDHSEVATPPEGCVHRLAL